MLRLLSVLILLLCTLPDWALATTYYYRPGFTSNRTPLTYGTGDGLSWANARAGFAGINAGTITFAPGDIICLPANDEPFYGEQLNYQKNAVSGTAGHPITFKGCGVTKALMWSASDLTGDRSYTSTKTPINGAAYEWVTVAPNIYRKRIDFRPRVLWEDTTWLEPFWTGTGAPGSGANFLKSIDTLSEATIIATLPAGKWGNKDNGDGTFRLYYHATSAAKSPTTATIRSNAIPLGITSLVIVVKSYITVQDIEIRGHGSASNTAALIVASIVNLTNLTLERLLLFRNQYAVTFTGPNGNFADILVKDCEVLDTSGNGLSMRGGIGHTVDRYTVDGGQFSYTNAFFYNGTNFTGADGDGIGLGWEGGVWTDFVIKNATMVGNQNSAVYYGTNEVMQLTNLTLQSLYMSHNFLSCFAEGDGDGVHGTLLISGVVCAKTGDKTGMHFTGAAAIRVPLSISADFNIEDGRPVSRQIVMEHITFAGNMTKERIRMRNDTNNHYHLSNIVFWDIPGSATNPVADIGVYGPDLTAGDDTFENIYFSSAINQHKKLGFRSIPSTSFYYDVPGDGPAFTAVLHGTNIVFNVDPLLGSAIDLRPQLGSPLLQAGAFSATCHDARLFSTVCGKSPDIGAYQTQVGDPSDNSSAAPRARPRRRF